MVEERQRPTHVTHVRDTTPKWQERQCSSYINTIKEVPKSVTKHHKKTKLAKTLLFLCSLSLTPLKVSFLFFFPIFLPWRRLGEGGPPVLLKT